MARVVTVSVPAASSVLAVIVTYNPASSVERVLSVLRSAVGKTVVVDNGSDHATLADLRRIVQGTPVQLIEAGVNLGVAHALNVAISVAQRSGCGWLLTLDQDSVPDSGMIPAMLHYAVQNPGVRCLSPNIVSHATDRSRRMKNGPVRYAITSGNLVRLDLFEAVGTYSEDLFIDCVDFDFSLRVRAAGYEIHKVEAARLFHDVGEVGRVPAAFRGIYTQHTPVRRYYSYRNLIVLVKRHRAVDPQFLLKLTVGQVVLLVLILIFDQRRLENARMIWTGLSDGFAGRLGPYGASGERGAS